MTMLGLEINRFEDTFNNVLALYIALIENRNNMRVKQVEKNANGEVPADPLDFMCDVEKRARTALAPKDYTLFLAFSANNAVHLIPDNVKLGLGKTWYENSLDISGSYRSLYFRVKNQMERDNLRARINGNTES